MKSKLYMHTVEHIVTDLLKASLGVLAPALHNVTVEACCATVCSDHVIPHMT
jgi:hypothetical protein